MCRGEKNEIFAGRQPCVFPLALHPSYAWVVIGPSRHLFARPRPRLFAADVPFVATSIAGSSSSFAFELQSRSRFSIFACRPSVFILRVFAFWSFRDPFTRSSSRSAPRTPFCLARGPPMSVSVPSAWVSFASFGVIALSRCPADPPVWSDRPDWPSSLSALFHMLLSAPSYVTTLDPSSRPCRSRDSCGLTSPITVDLGVGGEGPSRVFSLWPPAPLGSLFVYASSNSSDPCPGRPASIPTSSC